ncbi:hypothetical protein AtNW77_Chr2g0263841 [Arabidopsis thaliana]
MQNKCGPKMQKNFCKKGIFSFAAVLMRFWTFSINPCGPFRSFPPTFFPRSIPLFSISSYFFPILYMLYICTHFIP